ncbi:prickle-like protein 4 isoform X3 [Camelus dromedarius]|uniref:Prickle-like protein 4 isoform X1 n=3 Tax=Camelus TaxID=9836 RepID=A0A8B8RM87_CAMFR|nr:prickle-like protein 4 isoform X1 [Camelus bactrianus]XP_010972024.1 prickle-like protein 4 isoform X1 [Camelus bactrianus]XP_032318950.1 prickle-like protein 4 isoform X1 [Camelus ferus]XP_032318951.1 prickle-like protein 4 isoform X1 [Camelus ferus]XP_032318952.1 prickle-like protein 4 isoform X1 [Camelus ferus]XP_045365356.1 prickle-like protein 4 isoform X1 [Camelus bactrianus]
MSLLNSGCPHQGERLTLLEPNPPPVNSDSHPGHMPAEDPEETSALVCPENLSLGSPGLDTKQAPSWPGLRTLLQQLPPQDSDERYCLALGEEELAELRLFCAQRRREALGQGVARLVPPKLEECICEKQCREQLRPGEYGVFAARAGEQRCWHRACFACQACGQTLINLIYFYHDGRLYCGRHHAELLRPRCPACDQLIFSRRCTQAEGRRWHENHFCCQDCAGPLGGGRYALPGGGPCCPSCFESRYSNAGSSPAPMLEGRASPGEAGLGRAEDGERDSRNAATISRAALFATAASSGLETRRGMLGFSPGQECRAGDQAEAPKGQEQGLLETPLNPKEDAPCPTCSSSSESEPEGFFLGQRLPGPWETSRSLQTGDSDTSRKHCAIC